MKVQNRFLLMLSMLLLAAVVYSAISQLRFLSHAERGTGVVRELRAVNTRCGKGMWSRCTKFFVTVDLQSSAGPQTLFLGAGRARGYDQPLSKARYQIGDPVPVVFTPNRDEETYRDEPSDIWAFPLSLLFLQIVTLIASLLKRESEEPVTLKL
jgi:hypothetical protein